MHHVTTKLKIRTVLVRFVVMLLATGVIFAANNVDAKPKKDGQKSGQHPKDGGKKDQNKKGQGKKKGKKGHGKKRGHRKHRKGGGRDNANIRPEVMRWILQNNPGLGPSFLTHEPPDRVIKLPNGQSLPIYRLDQFLDVNFRLSFNTPDDNGKAIVKESSMRLRKLLATPEFRNHVKHYKPQYHIAGRGKVSAAEAYSYIRQKHKQIAVKAGKQYHGTVGGGGGIAAPSYRMWKAMNLFWHESCHCIGIGHNSGGLSGVIAGRLKDMDKKKKWKYSTVDLNSLKVP